MADNQPSWRDPRIASTYIKDVQRIYQQSPGIKVTVQLIMSVFAVAFFTFFAIRPTLGTISELLKKIEDQKEVDRKLDTKIVQLTEAQTELIENEADLPLINLAIPEVPDLKGFIQRLEVLAVASEAELGSVQFQAVPLVGERTSLTAEPSAKEDEPEGEGLFITFNFVINGNQANILAFLSALETIDRAVAITRLTFAKPPLQQQKFYTLTANGRGTIYYQPAAGQ